MRDKERINILPLISGMPPPTRPVLPPCGTMNKSCASASAKISETCSVEFGKRTAAASPLKLPRQSSKKGAISALSVMIFFVPRIVVSVSIIIGLSIIYLPPHASGGHELPPQCLFYQLGQWRWLFLLSYQLDEAPQIDLPPLQSHHLSLIG